MATLLRFSVCLLLTLQTVWGENTPTETNLVVGSSSVSVQPTEQNIGADTSGAPDRRLVAAARQFGSLFLGKMLGKEQDEIGLATPTAAPSFRKLRKRWDKPRHNGTRHSYGHGSRERERDREREESREEEGMGEPEMLEVGSMSLDEMGYNPRHRPLQRAPGFEPFLPPFHRDDSNSTEDEGTVVGLEKHKNKFINISSAERPFGGPGPWSFFPPPPFMTNGNGPPLASKSSKSTSRSNAKVGDIVAGTGWHTGGTAAGAAWNAGQIVGGVVPGLGPSGGGGGWGGPGGWGWGMGMPGWGGWGGGGGGGWPGHRPGGWGGGGGTGGGGGWSGGGGGWSGGWGSGYHGPKVWCQGCYILA